MLTHYHSHLSLLLGDPEMEAAVSSTALFRAMLAFEAALAESQGELGTVPSEAAIAIASAARELQIDPGELAEATERDGVPVPALVARLREATAEPYSQFVHWGATSQDVIDTAAVLTLDAALALCAERLDRVIDLLAALADRHRKTAMPARTRGQQATPTSFGLKAAVWMMPLLRWRERLPRVRDELRLVSLGGASGTQAALGESARAIETALARRLGLAVGPLPWHATRDTVVEAGGWLAGLSGSLGKLAADIAELTSSEIGEVRISGAGESSTMPNKQNPTRAEAMVALAEQAAEMIGPLHRGALHRQERGGVAWFTEWLTLPRLAVATGAALRHGEALLAGLDVQSQRMRANLEASNGLLLAEAASFALARHMPRPEAEKRVKEACTETLETGTNLIDVLAARCDAPIDWAALRDPALQLGEAEAMIDRALAAARQRPLEDSP